MRDERLLAMARDINRICRDAGSAPAARLAVYGAYPGVDEKTLGGMREFMNLPLEQNHVRNAEKTV